MHRYACALFLVVSIAGCGELAWVPPPPVPLSALEGPQAIATADKLMSGSQREVRLVRAVPAQALCTIHVPDIGSSIERFKQTGLYAWLTSPEVKKQLGPTAEVFGSLQLPGGPGGPGNIDVNRILKALSGEFILSLGDIRVREGQAFPDVKVLAGITVSGAEREAEQLLELVDMLAANQPGVHVEKGTTAAHGFSRIVGKTPQPWVVELALYDDALLAGFGRDTVTEALSRLENVEELSLADSVAFRTCMERCGDPRDAVRIYVNLATAWARYGKYMPREARRVVQALKLDDMRSLAMAVRFEGKDIGISTLIDSPGGRDVITQVLAAHTVDLQLLERIPSDANSFSIFALDGLRIIGVLREVLPDQMRRSFEDTLKTLREDGVDLEKDIFEVFGPRCAIVSVPTGHRDAAGLDLIWNQLLGTSLVFEVQDPVSAEQTLQRLPDETSFARRREVVLDGVRAWSYQFEREGMPSEFSICYALVENYLILAPSERTLRRMLRTRSASASRHFGKLLKDAPDTAVVVTYDRGRQGLGLQLGALMQSFAQGMGAPKPPEQATKRLASLPPMGPSLSHTVADKRGVFSFTRSPTAGIGSTGGLSGLAMVAAIAIPSLHTARLKANESAALASLRSIYTAQETYRTSVMRDADEDGEGEYAFIGELLGDPRLGEETTRAHRALMSGQWTRRKGDFIRGGYRFRAYLPAEDGSPIGENARASRIKRVDGDLAETVMVVLAWPVSRGITGERAFYMDASGRVHACRDGSYTKDTAPPPDVLSSQRGNLASRPLRAGELARDGNRWDRLR
ncbi:MAG: hypothetical protein ACYTDU_06600 [Planctomycetota bacterium]|jgi:hypothetical protein